jgi:hypothetical protein
MARRLASHAVAFVGSTIMLCHGAATSAAEIPWTAQIPLKIDASAAQILAAEAYGPPEEPTDFDPDPNNAMNPRFFIFYGMNRPSVRIVHGGFGFFAVNPWTGDVWALWGCYKLSSRAVRKSQAEIRQRFTEEELKQYEKLRHLKPECVVQFP